MVLSSLFSVYKNHQEEQLFHRYIHNEMIEPLLKKLPSKFQVDIIGKSVLGKSIYAVKIGVGHKRVMLWSQMHGNESTTTKAIFDVFNTFKESNQVSDAILNACTFLFIPILNPDGAQAYNRLNANNVDLNRDAKDLSQPESVVLRQQFDLFKPDFCFNLHGQRTIFSAGNNNKAATLSFLSPAENEMRSVTETRKKAMHVIAVVNNELQNEIPNQIGRYDDTYNENCVGDTFQRLGVPTLLYEAGHYANDYMREKTREYVYKSLMVAFYHIASCDSDESDFEHYFEIPQNEKLFLDILIRNAKVIKDGQYCITDLGFMFKEQLQDDKINFTPILEKIEKLDGFFGHRELNANNDSVLTVDCKELYVGYENDFVLLNNEKYSLLFSKS
jgi:hypothetical protein